MPRLRAGAFWFLAIVFGLAWIPALLLDGVWHDPGDHPSVRLLRASLVYAAVLGWQPIVASLLVRHLVDRDRSIDHGIRPVTPRFSALAVIAPVILLAAAAGCDLLLDGAALAQPEAAARGSAPAVISMMVAFVAMLAVLWLQALGEELGWRGYLLGHLMRDLGAWPGLIMHGVLWGLWYAPLFVLGGDHESGERLACFVVTCALLGTLLGWLRLASGSVFVSAAANAVLTVGAGLPLLLQGTSSTRSAIFEPVGWLPMLGVLIAIAAVSSLRGSVAQPVSTLPDDVN